MSGLGGNLTYKERPLLITNLTVADFGLHTETDPDTATSRLHLLVKKIGLDIVYDSAVKFSKSCTKEGKLKSVLLKLECPEPQSLFNYSYGIDILKKVKDPGVLNDDFLRTSRHYGGQIMSLQTCSGGELADSDKVIMENRILTDILADRDFGTREESIVDGKRVYLVTLNSAATDKINVTDADGTVTTIDLDGSTTMLQAIDDFNTDTAVASLGLIAFAKSATQMYITSTAVGTLFTIADGGGATTVAINDRYLWIYSRDVEVQFEVQYPSEWLTLSRFNVLVLANAYTAVPTTVFAIGGTQSGAITGHATSSTYAARINDCTLTQIYASATLAAGSVPIYVWSGIYELKVVRLGTGVTISTAYSGNGVYPSLTWKDVFREFAEVPQHLGGNKHLVSYGAPAEGDLYCKIRIEKTNTIANMHGASHSDGYQQAIEIYIKQGNGLSHLWDASGYMWETIADDATFVADSDINDLLLAWSGTAIVSAIP